MTTDTFPKLAWGSLTTDTGVVRVLGMAKGAGMIAPNMATMIGLVFCDAKVGSLWWQEAVAAAADRSFNSITVDGDMSTNDCLLALANGASEVTIDSAEGRQALLGVMVEVCQALAAMLVQDAEGGTKVLRIKVHGAASHAEAELAARAVGNSPLVKTAFFGRDANWGRIVCALGRSGASFDPNQVSLRIGGVPVVPKGAPGPEDLAALLAPPRRRGTGCRAGRAASLWPPRAARRRSARPGSGRHPPPSARRG
jgi:glutamate N-acetyltransferase/amino-acid N-acetyltransferase